MTWHDSTQCGCPKVSYSACLQVINDGCDPIVMDLRAAKRGGANNEILKGRCRNFLICRQLIAPELPSVYNFSAHQTLASYLFASPNTCKITPQFLEHLAPSLLECFIVVGSLPVFHAVYD